MHKQLTVGVIAMSPTGEVGAASTLGAHNAHRGRSGFPAVCWRRRVGLGNTEVGIGGVGSGGGVGGAVGGISGGKVDTETSVTATTITTATATATSTVDVAAVPGTGVPPPHWELVKDLPSGGGSLYIIQADAQGETF